MNFPQNIGLYFIAQFHFPIYYFWLGIPLCSFNLWYNLSRTKRKQMRVTTEMEIYRIPTLAPWLLCYFLKKTEVCDSCFLNVNLDHGNQSDDSVDQTISFHMPETIPPICLSIISLDTLIKNGFV